MPEITSEYLIYFTLLISTDLVLIKVDGTLENEAFIEENCPEATRIVNEVLQHSHWIMNIYLLVL